jgi:DNA-binding MarR family transcriptional regulator
MRRRSRPPRHSPPQRCRPVPIPSKPPCSHTRSVCRYRLPTLAPSNRTTTVRRPDDDDRPLTPQRDTAAFGRRVGPSAAGAVAVPNQLEAAADTLSASDDALARQHRSLSLDRFLELVHREDLSPVDLRVLLRVTNREATVRELASSMGLPPTVIRRASGRLVARGLLRRRRRRTGDHRLEVMLETTASGMHALLRVTEAMFGDRTGRLASATPRRSETGIRAG